MLDLMVNHISRESIYFQDFLKKGFKSKYSDLFITINKIWGNRYPTSEEISKIFLRRKEPFSTFYIKKTGKIEKIWTTFGKENPSEQIDIDINSKIARKLLTDFLIHFSKNNIKIIRLDAVGYVIKKPGTTCFFIEPEIYEFLEWITQLVNSLGLELLPEVHAHYSIQFKLASHGYWIYDFILPYMILETMLNKSNVNLLEYLKIRPYKQFTMLDCHDGIPIKPDINDLYNSRKVRNIVKICLDRGANLSYLFSPKHKDEDGFDVHQIRCSYYSVLNCNDDAYLAARAIQFFVPGIPQVYYVGLLAGKNDEEKVKITGDGKEINRHNFSIEEIDQAIKQNVVQRLLKLIRFRNEFPAFNGNFKILDSANDKISFLWKKDEKSCELKIDLKDYKTIILYSDDSGKRLKYIV